MTFVAGAVLQMRTVPEIVEVERGPERGAVRHRLGLTGMTSSASSKLIARLMCVTRIALGMLRHARLQALRVKAVTETTFGRAVRHLVRFHLPFHFF